MSEYYGVTRSDESLKHYGIKGMKWGVRKALYTGNQKALDRHFKKAAKKLYKLQDIGMRPGKYAAKAAAYGAAAAGTGTLAVGGTGTVAGAIKKLSPLVRKASLRPNGTVRNLDLYFLSRDMKEKIPNRLIDFGNKEHNFNILTRRADSNAPNPTHPTAVNQYRKLTITNNDLFRAGAGLATAGLAAKSAQNAYRATHAKKYRAKAEAFKNAMDESFAGTQYAGKYVYQKPKRRKRR
jgi:hypothetical protein